MKKLVTLGIVSLALAVVPSLRAADVKALYEKECAKCHGADGKGDTKMGKKVGVQDYTDPKVQEKMKDDDMAKVIKEGKKDGDKTKMKAFDSMSDEEVKGLVALIRGFKK